MNTITHYAEWTLIQIVKKSSLIVWPDSVRMQDSATRPRLPPNST